MLLRKPCVAGRFYPGDAASLGQTLATLFQTLPAEPDARVPDTPCLLMLPHAGYVFSAPMAAATLANVALPGTVVLLCPNHTGLGHPFGVWAEGAWETPLGRVAVNTELAQALCAEAPFAADTASHVREHSIEVQLPLLQYLRPANPPAIVPVSLGTQHPRLLESAGRTLARVMGADIAAGRVLLIVSSDMNHYEDEETTRRKDEHALACVLAEEPENLLARCRTEHITMCGAGPMAMALFALRDIRQGRPPSRRPRLVGHTSSGPVSRDFGHVVGYAGVRIYL